MTVLSVPAMIIQAKQYDCHTESTMKPKELLMWVP